MTIGKQTAAVKRTVKKYGAELCKRAFELAEKGNGARTIGDELGVHTNAADALINAGRDLSLRADPQTVDITPDWVDIVPVWLMLLRDCDPAKKFEVFENTKAEFMRMAKAADNWNKHINKILK